MQKRNIEDFYPLSPMQQGMYFHHQFTPGKGMYVEQLCCQLKGPMNTDAFRNSWQQLVNRYTILRTSFVSSGLKEPLQIVHRNVAVSLQQLDWSDRDNSKVMSDISEFQTNDQLRDFDLSIPSPMRLTLIKVSEDVNIFIWTYHHILLDGWSVPILLNELFSFYRSLCQGINPEFTPVRPYRDYIVWLKKQNLGEASAYWREYMKGYENQLPLFFDKLSGKLSANDEEYDQIEFELPESFTSELLKFAGKESITINTCLQGAWALLMSRYKECNDIVFGATVSGRPTELKDAENMIGLFINTLPVRIRLNDTTQVTEWLKQIQRDQVESRKYEFSSLSEIRKFYDMPSDSPVFESILVFENYSVPEMMTGIEDFEIKEIGSHDETNFPLTLVAGLSERLMLRMVYSRTRFDKVYIENMLQHIASLLSGFVCKSGQNLSSLDLLSESERERIIKTWNNSESDYPSEDCIHWQFEKQVIKTPNAIAIYHDGNHLTYHQLNKRANILAWKLKENGVGPESLVGILMNKSIDMIVSILAVLKAGGAYVPLDPLYPARRLQFMMTDSNIKVLITSEELVQQIPMPDCRIVYAHSVFFQTYKEREQNLKAYCEPESLAYVIYTSGSTGMPKGALLHHRGVINFAKAYREKVGINTGSRVLQLFSFSFDGAVGDIFPALLYGGTLVLYTGNTDIQSTKLENIISDCAINIALLPPAILTSISRSRFPELHTIISGGEACPVETAKRWSLNRCFINAYGPTEATVAALWYKVADRKELSVTVPLGQPIENYRVYILDKNLRPVPAGIPGEICISGVGL
ncbi:MAG: condensation domain-containing protein, partial [Syntrophothermus sp.]